jgi:hypothetical protein
VVPLLCALGDREFPARFRRAEHLLVLHAVVEHHLLEVSLGVTPEKQP